MTPALRKYHRQVWNVLAIAFPVLLAASIAAIPERKPDPQFNRYLPAALPEVLKSVENEAFLVRWRTNRLDGQQQLEVIVRQPLTVPAALIYLSEQPGDQPKDGIFIGSLTSKGEYRFRLGSDISMKKEHLLLLFDPVKNKIFETIKL